MKNLQNSIHVDANIKLFCHLVVFVFFIVITYYFFLINLINNFN